MAADANTTAMIAAIQAAITQATTALNQQTTQLGQGLTQGVNNLIQEVQGIPAAVQGILPAAPALPAAGAYSRSPLATNVAAQLDYETKTDTKYYENATKSVMPYKGEFDVEPNRFHLFVDQVLVRARDTGMLEPGQIVMVPTTLPIPAVAAVPAAGGVAAVAAVPAVPAVGPFCNAIQEYGSKTLEEICAWERTFIAEQGRMSQNSKILFDAIMASLTTMGLQRIRTWSNEYTIVVNGESYDAGLTLFKVVVRES